MMDDDLWQQPVQWYERFYPADHIESTPADWEYRNMLRIVAYDITDDKRLRKVAKSANSMASESKKASSNAICQMNASKTSGSNSWASSKKTMTVSSPIKSAKHASNKSRSSAKSPGHARQSAISSDESQPQSQHDQKPQ